MDIVTLSIVLTGALLALAWASADMPKFCERIAKTLEEIAETVKGL